MSGSSEQLPAAIYDHTNIVIFPLFPYKICIFWYKVKIPAMSTDDSALVAMLDGLASNVQQALGPFIAILIHMEV
jgi:hypothetical protein